MSQKLDDLYQEIILSHNKTPRNYGPMPHADRRAKSFNRICGDEVEVYLQLSGERILAVSFQGQGCAISKASASLMTQAIKGLTCAQALNLINEIKAVVGSEAPISAPVAGSELEALSGLRKFPSRSKCAMLAWDALGDALNQSSASSKAK